MFVPNACISSDGKGGFLGALISGNASLISAASLSDSSVWVLLRKFRVLMRSCVCGVLIISWIGGYGIVT